MGGIRTDYEIEAVGVGFLGQQPVRLATNTKPIPPVTSVNIHDVANRPFCLPHPTAKLLPSDNSNL
jgi:hypothetical protein